MWLNIVLNSEIKPPQYLSADFLEFSPSLAFVAKVSKSNLLEITFVPANGTFLIALTTIGPLANKTA